MHPIFKLIFLQKNNTTILYRETKTKTRIERRVRSLVSQLVTYGRPFEVVFVKQGEVLL